MRHLSQLNVRDLIQSRRAGLRPLEDFAEEGGGKGFGSGEALRGRGTRVLNDLQFRGQMRGNPLLLRQRREGDLKFAEFREAKVLDIRAAGSFIPPRAEGV